MKFEVVFYEKLDGTKPVADFIKSLPAAMRAKITRSLRLLEDNGTRLREPYSKPLRDGIFELRVKFASDISRILYFFFVGNKIIVTNGFVKKADKAPPNEIERAKQYRKDFMDREERRKNDDVK